MNYKAAWRIYLIEDEERAESTVRQYLWRVDTAERVSGVSIIELAENTDLLRELKLRLKKMGWAPETIKGVIVGVRQFSRWAWLSGLLDRVPNADLVKTPRIEIQEPKPLTREEAHELMAACRRPLEYRLIYYGLFAGCRIGESASMDASHWHDDGVLRFPGNKNRRGRIVPIHRELQGVKAMILAHPPTYDSTLQRVKRRLEKRTGIDFVAHQLRKTFATVHDECGTPDRIIKDMLGHAFDTTGRYIGLSLSRKRAAQERYTLNPEEPIAAFG